jgi:pyruvate/2-oxoglutarate dehydrogenase complex dihydrolipoamide dehydrogenase (E3) component
MRAVHGVDRGRQIAHDAGRAHAEGILGDAPTLDFAAVMRRRARIVEIADNERDERFTRAGIDVIRGRARFRDEHALRPNRHELP